MNILRPMLGECLELFMDLETDRRKRTWCVTQLRIIIELRLNLLLAGELWEDTDDNMTVIETERPRLCLHKGGEVARCWPGQDCQDVWRHSDHQEEQEFLLFTDCCDSLGSCWTMLTERCSLETPHTESPTTGVKFNSMAGLTCRKRPINPKAEF